MDSHELARHSLGFPDATTFLGTTASSLGECVVALVRVATDPSHQDRLYLRHFASSTYRQIPWPEGCNSFDFPIVSHAAPELFVLGKRWVEIQAAEGAAGEPPLRGADAAGIYRIRLPHGDAELVHGGLHRRLREAASVTGEDQSFVSELVGMTPDGTRLLVKRGRGVVENTQTTWAYSIAEFEPLAGVFRDLTELPAVFA